MRYSAVSIHVPLVEMDVELLPRALLTLQVNDPTKSAILGLNSVFLYVAVVVFSTS